MYSASVITRRADGVISEIHQRKPVIIEPAGIPLWLRVKGNAQTTLPWAASKKTLVQNRLSNAVNSRRTTGPELIEPLELEAIISTN